MKYLFDNSRLYHLPIADPSKISISGNNKKNILVVLNEDDFTEATQILLSKILKAIHCELEEDITLLKIQKEHEISIKEYLDQFQSKTVLSFGIPPGKLSLKLSPNVKSYFRISDTGYIFSSSLVNLTKDRNKKLALWNQLKKHIIE